MGESKISNSLHVAFFPASDEKTASSRIRVYTIARELVRWGVSVSFGSEQQADILFIQKRVNSHVLKYVRLAKFKGKPIIYDVDDFGAALRYWASDRNFASMLRLADVVTTASEEQLKLLTTGYHVKQATVLLSAIDYYPTRPVQPLLVNREYLRLVWFGSSSTFHLFEHYLPWLLQISYLKVVIISSSDIKEKHSKRYPTVEFRTWSLADFVSTLQTCDLSCLMHDGSTEDRAKGNNKMIASITYGVPAVVSRTPAYESTAREAGVEDALFSNEQELRMAIERLRSLESRQKYLELAQPVIWERYAPEVVARQYVDLALKCLQNRHSFFKLLKM